MTEREALNMALQALETLMIERGSIYDKAITAIKEALVQPEQPKVRTGNCLRVGVCASEGQKIQPQRTWVGLTDEEREEIALEVPMDAVLITEAKLKAKNT